MKRLFTLLVLFAAAVNGQSDGPPVATVGPNTISTKEFIDRFELTPGLRHGKNIEAQKGEFLLSLIAEKLLVLMAQRNGWDNGPSVQRTLHAVERNFVRDELYRREVMNKVDLTEREIGTAMKKASVDHKVYFLFAPERRTADSLAAAIRNGVPMAAIIHDTVSHDGWDADSAIARWGEMDERMERQVYSVALGRSSDPFALDDGWYIVSPVERTVTVAADDDARKELRERVVSVLRRRKELVRMNEYMNEALKETRTDIDAGMFRSVVEQCYSMADTMEARPDTAAFIIDASVASAVISAIADSAQRPLVMFKDTVWSAATAMSKIAETGLAIPSPTRQSVAHALEQRLKDLIDQEFLIRIGYAKHLDQSSAVRNDMKPWREAAIASFVRDKVADSVTVSEQDIREIRQAFREDSVLLRSDSAAVERGRALKVVDDVDRLAGMSASGTPITIYKKNLDAITVSGTPTMVYRIVGFGGRMFAVPFVVPQTGWIRYWNGQPTVLP